MSIKLPHKIITTILAMAFLASSVDCSILSAAQSDSLAAGSVFSGLSDYQHRDITTIKIAFQLSLVSFAGSDNKIDIDLLLKKSSQYKDTIYNPPDMQFFVQDPERLHGDCRAIMCRVVDQKTKKPRDYFVVFSIKKVDGGFPMEVYTPEEFDKLKRQVVTPDTIPQRKDSSVKAVREDAGVIARDIRHQRGMDRVIEYAHKHNLAKKPLKELFDYKHRIKRLLGKNSLNLELTYPDGIKRIEDRDFFLVKVAKGEELDRMLAELAQDSGEGEGFFYKVRLKGTDGKEYEVRYCAHSSNNAVHIVLNEESFEFLTSGKDAHKEPLSADDLQLVLPMSIILPEHLDRILTHEIGDIIRSPILAIHASDGISGLAVQNALDYRFQTAIENQWLKSHGEKYEPLERMSAEVADLDVLVANGVERDYAATEDPVSRHLRKAFEESIELHWNNATRGRVPLFGEDAQLALNMILIAASSPAVYEFVSGISAETASHILGAAMLSVSPATGTREKAIPFVDRALSMSERLKMPYVLKGLNTFIDEVPQKKLSPSQRAHLTAAKDGINNFDGQLRANNVRALKVVLNTRLDYLAKTGEYGIDNEDVAFYVEQIVGHIVVIFGKDHLGENMADTKRDDASIYLNQTIAGIENNSRLEPRIRHAIIRESARIIREILPSECVTKGSCSDKLIRILIKAASSLPKEEIKAVSLPREDKATSIPAERQIIQLGLLDPDAPHHKNMALAIIALEKQLDQFETDYSAEIETFMRMNVNSQGFDIAMRRILAAFRDLGVVYEKEETHAGQRIVKLDFESTHHIGNERYAIPAFVYKDGEKTGYQYWNILQFVREKGKIAARVVPCTDEEMGTLLNKVITKNKPYDDIARVSFDSDVIWDFIRQERYDRDVVKWAHDKGNAKECDRNTFARLLAEIADKAGINKEFIDDILNTKKLSLAPLTPNALRRLVDNRVIVTTADGERVPVTAFAHSSNHDILIFIGQGINDPETSSAVKEHLACELGDIARCQTLRVENGKPVNEIYERYEAGVKGKKNPKAHYRMGDLDNLVVKINGAVSVRDYASGMSGDAKRAKEAEIFRAWFKKRSDSMVSGLRKNSAEASELVEITVKIALNECASGVSTDERNSRYDDLLRQFRVALKSAAKSDESLPAGNGRAIPAALKTLTEIFGTQYGPENSATETLLVAMWKAYETGVVPDIGDIKNHAENSGLPIGIFLSVEHREAVRLQGPYGSNMSPEAEVFTLLVRAFRYEAAGNGTDPLIVVDGCSDILRVELYEKYPGDVAKQREVLQNCFDAVGKIFDIEDVTDGYVISLAVRMLKSELKNVTARTGHAADPSENMSIAARECMKPQDVSDRVDELWESAGFYLTQPFSPTGLNEAFVDGNEEDDDEIRDSVYRALLGIRKLVFTDDIRHIYNKTLSPDTLFRIYYAYFAQDMDEGPVLDLFEKHFPENEAKQKEIFENTDLMTLYFAAKMLNRNNVEYLYNANLNPERYDIVGYYGGRLYRERDAPKEKKTVREAAEGVVIRVIERFYECRSYEEALTIAEVNLEYLQFVRNVASNVNDTAWADEKIEEVTRLSKQIKLDMEQSGLDEPEDDDATETVEPVTEDRERMDEAFIAEEQAPVFTQKPSEPRAEFGSDSMWGDNGVRDTALQMGISSPVTQAAFSQFLERTAGFNTDDFPIAGSEMNSLTHIRRQTALLLLNGDHEGVVKFYNELRGNLKAMRDDAARGEFITKLRGDSLLNLGYFYARMMDDDSMYDIKLGKPFFTTYASALTANSKSLHTEEMVGDPIKCAESMLAAMRELRNIFGGEHDLGTIPAAPDNTKRSFIPGFVARYALEQAASYIREGDRARARNILNKYLVVMSSQYSLLTAAAKNGNAKAALEVRARLNTAIDKISEVARSLNGKDRPMAAVVGEGIELSDLVLHDIDNALIGMCLDERLAKKKRYTYKDTGEKVDLFLLGDMQQKNISFLDLFNALVRLRLGNTRRSPLLREEIKVANNILDRAGAGYRIETRKELGRFKTGLWNQIEHFSYKTGALYVMAGYEPLIDKIAGHARVERNIHRAAEDKVFFGYRQKYLKWRQEATRLEWVVLPEYDISGKMNYNQFAERAHAFAESRYPVALINTEPGQIDEMISLAKLAGGKISAAQIAGGRYKLLMPMECFAGNEYGDQKKSLQERFDLVGVSGIMNSPADFIANLESKIAAGEDERTVALLPNTLTQEQIENIRNKYRKIRFILIDFDTLSNIKSLLPDARKHFQADAYAVMLLIRYIKNADVNSAEYRSLQFYLRSHFEFQGGITTDDYINAVISGDIPKLIKAYLLSRPTERYDLQEYEKISPTLISA